MSDLKKLFNPFKSGVLWFTTITAILAPFIDKNFPPIVIQLSLIGFYFILIFQYGKIISFFGKNIVDSNNILFVRARQKYEDIANLLIPEGLY